MYGLVRDLSYSAFSETSVDFQQTARRYIPEDSSLIITAVRTSNPTLYSL
jgi:hypothetical protein